MSDNDNLSNASDDTDEILKRGLVEVSLTGQGLDEELDSALSQLRIAIRDPNGTNKGITDALDSIETRQNELEDIRENFSTLSATAIKDITRPLVEFGLDQSKIRSKVSALNNRSFPLLKLAHVLKTVAEITNTIEDDGSTQHPFQQIAHQKILVLVNQLKVPPGFRAALKEFKALMEDESIQLDFSTLLDRLSQFVIELLNTEQESLKSYLENLDEPLRIIENLMIESEAHLGHRGQLQERFNIKLESGLKDIKESLASGDDVASLKQKIQLRLEVLTQEFSDYNQERNTLENDLIQQYQSMKSELSQLQIAQKNAVKELKKYQQQSLTDALTSLPNRGAWDQHITTEWQRFFRYGHPLTLAIVDIDHFKVINDSFGHQTGDMVLRAVSLQLKKYLRSTDIIARFGGEEFGLLLTNTLLPDAVTAMNHVKDKIKKSKFKYQGQEIRISVSIGIAQATKSLNPEMLFKLADDALYLAKNSGRNLVKTSDELD